MTLLGLTSAITMMRRGRAHQRGELIINHSPVGTLDVAIHDLSAPEKEAIKTDIANAVDILATAGIISETDKSAALVRELGALDRWRWVADRFESRRR